MDESKEALYREAFMWLEGGQRDQRRIERFCDAAQHYGPVSSDMARILEGILHFVLDATNLRTSLDMAKASIQVEIEKKEAEIAVLRNPDDTEKA